MCRHIYTRHICGHKSVESEQCDLALMPTAVLFCEKYDVAQESSLRPCRFVYCEEDKEVAHWVQKGPAELAACGEDISDLKRRLDMCQRETKILAWYQAQWGPLQREKEVKRAKGLHSLATELQQALQGAKERHRNIVTEMSLTKQKLDRSAESIARSMAQFERTTIQMLRQSAMSEPQATPAASYQYPMVTEAQGLPQPVLGQKRIPSSHHPGGARPLRFAPPLQSSNSLGASLTPTNAEGVLPAKSFTPTRATTRRARTRRAYESKKSPAPFDDVSRTPASNRKRPAEVERLPSSATRRSGRLETKKQISYAESSGSGTPDPSPSKVVRAAPKRSRTNRRTSKRDQIDEDIVFETADDSDDDEADEADEAIDGDWHDAEVDVGFELVRTTRSSNKRASNNPSASSRPRKRRAAARPAAPKTRTQPARTGAKARVQSAADRESKPSSDPTPAYSAWLSSREPAMNVAAARWRDPAAHVSSPPEFGFVASQGSFPVSEADRVGYAPGLPTFIPNPLAASTSYGPAGYLRGAHAHDAVAGPLHVPRLQQFELPVEDMAAYEFEDVPGFDMNVDLAGDHANAGAQGGYGM